MTLIEYAVSLNMSTAAANKLSNAGTIVVSKKGIVNVEKSNKNLRKLANTPRRGRKASWLSSFAVAA